MSKRKLDEQQERHENYQLLNPHQLHLNQQPNLGTSPLSNQNNFIQSGNQPQHLLPINNNNNNNIRLYNIFGQPQLPTQEEREQQHSNFLSELQSQQQRYQQYQPQQFQFHPADILNNNQILQSPQLLQNIPNIQYPQYPQEQQFTFNDLISTTTMPKLPTNSTLISQNNIILNPTTQMSMLLSTPDILPPPQPQPILESSIVDSQGKEITLSNLLIIKIFQHKLEYLKNDTQRYYDRTKQLKSPQHILYDFLNCIQMVCKSWNLFIIPKLDIGKYGFQDIRCNNYIDMFSKLTHLTEQVQRGYISSGYQFAFKRSEFKNYDRISKLLSLLYQPIYHQNTENFPFSFSTTSGRKPRSEISEIKESKIPTILINGIDFGTIFNPNISNILNTSKSSLLGGSSNSPNEIVNSNSFDLLDANNTLIRKPVRYRRHHDLFESGYPNYSIEFDKLLIYQEGVQYSTDHLNKSDENNNESPKIGVLLHSFCTTDYQGGEFEFLHSLDSQKKHTIKFGIQQQQYESVSFFNGSLVNIKPITSGINILAKYNIHLDTKHCFHDNDENYHNDKDGNYDDEPTTKFDFSNITNQLITQSPYDNLSIKKSISNYNYSVIFEISNILNKSDLKVHNVALFLTKHYKNYNISLNELNGIDLIMYEKLKEIYGSSRLSISTFLIKAGSPHTIEILSHKSVALGLYENNIKHTLVYPSERFVEKLKPFKEEDDYESNGVDLFSAIVIKKEN